MQKIEEVFNTVHDYVKEHGIEKEYTREVWDSERLRAINSRLTAVEPVYSKLQFFRMRKESTSIDVHSPNAPKVHKLEYVYPLDPDQLGNIKTTEVRTAQDFYSCHTTFELVRKRHPGDTAIDKGRSGTYVRQSNGIYKKA